MDRVQRSAAVVTGMQVALAGTNLQVEADQAARGQTELGPVRPRHPTVEDDASIGATLVVTAEVDDRVSADLLLAVAGDPEVYRQCTFSTKQLRRLQQREELALVVGDATGVVPTVALGELEGRRIPEFERRGRLHVEMPVDHHRRRRAAVRARGQI